jgi:hypothetical protein
MLNMIVGRNGMANHPGRVDLLKHAPQFDEVAGIPEVWDDDVPKWRAAYSFRYNRQTSLTDKDIVNLIAYSDDDMDDSDKAEYMCCNE